MGMVTLEWLRSFVAAVDYGSFKSAANHLFTSKATISLRMSALADELGFELFVKKRGTLVLTERGSHLLKIAREMIRLSDQIEGLKDNASISNTIHICAGNSLLVRQLLTPVMAFQRRNQNIQIELEGVPPEQIFSKLSRGTADIGITWDDIPSSAQMRKEKLFAIPFGFICHHSHPLAKCEVVGMQELADYPMIMRKKGSISRTIQDNWFTRYGRRPVILLEVNSNDDVVTAVASQYGGNQTVGIATNLCSCDGSPCRWIHISDLPNLNLYAYTRVEADNLYTQRLVNALAHLETERHIVENRESCI